MKVSPKTGLPLILLAALCLALAFGACSSSSNPVGGATKGLAFEVDESGNSKHTEGWEDEHQSASTGPEACASCHTSNPDLAPGCFNASLCHGADGEFDDSDDSGDSGDSADSDELEDDTEDDSDEGDSDED